MINIVRIALESSAQSAALALCVALILAAARIRSGAVRHAAWTAVLCGMMLMPVLSRITPKVPVTMPLPPLPYADLPAADEVAPPQQASAALSGSADLQLRNNPAPQPSAAISKRLPLPSLIVVVYLTGLLFSLFRLIPGWRAARRISRSCEPVQTPFSGVDVCESPIVTTPLTVGLLSPRIVLPLIWREWTNTKLLAVLAHEAAHVKNRDSLVNLAAYLNRCVFWFHPLAWWLRKKLATTAEHACDEAGAQAVGDTRDYASVLLEVAALAIPHGARCAFVGAGMEGDGGLEARIDHILLDGSQRAVSATRKAIVALACAVVLIAVPACRQVSSVKAPEKPTLLPEVQALIGIGSRSLFSDPQVQSQLEAARASLEQSADASVLAANGKALVNRFIPLAHFGREGFDVGAAAIARALQLDPKSQEVRRAQVLAYSRQLINISRGNPEDPETPKKLAFIDGELKGSKDVSFLLETATPMVSIRWPTGQGPVAAPEMFAVGKAAVERALRLDPNSVWAHQLMLKTQDQELVANLQESVWHGPLDSQHQAIQALPVGARFRELSILAATAGVSAMNTAYTHESPEPMWQAAGNYANEALALAPQAKDDPYYGTSFFRANMVAAMSALVRHDRATAIAFARKAMEAPPTEALRYPIVNARPWSNWHYPQIVIAQLIREGERDSAADLASQYSRIVIADKDRWEAAAAAIRKGETPDWVRQPVAGPRPPTGMKDSH